MMRLLLAASVITLFGCAAADDGPAEAEAATAADAGRDCFNTRNISGYSSVDDDTVQIRVGVNDYYDVDVFGTCNQLDWSNRLAIVSNSGSFICAGDISPGRLITEEENCSITRISRAYPLETKEIKPLDDSPGG